jgi:integrase
MARLGGQVANGDSRHPRHSDACAGPIEWRSAGPRGDALRTLRLVVQHPVLANRDPCQPSSPAQFAGSKATRARSAIWQTRPPCALSWARSAGNSTADRLLRALVSGKRAVFHNALEYAVERKLLASNPLAVIRVTNRKTVEEVDRRVVVNFDQACRLLTAVGQQGKSGARLIAFFALMYYAALRPGEAADLPESALQLPPTGWGELFLPGSAGA